MFATVLLSLKQWSSPLPILFVLTPAYRFDQNTNPEPDQRVLNLYKWCGLKTFQPNSEFCSFCERLPCATFRTQGIKHLAFLTKPSNYNILGSVNLHGFQALMKKH